MLRAMPQTPRIRDSLSSNCEMPKDKCIPGLRVRYPTCTKSTSGSGDPHHRPEMNISVAVPHEPTGQARWG